MKKILTYILILFISNTFAQVIILSENFDNGAPTGWTTSSSGNLSWTHGIPQGGRGDSGSGYADPTQDHTTSNTNNYVYGQGLSSSNGDGLGGYYDNIDEYLQTPAIDCSSETGVTLTFWRYANFENNYDEAYVEISTDGSNWTDLGEPQYPKDDAWTEVQIDISTYADGQSAVYIRWRMASDGSVTYSGWNIDDVSITADCPSPPAAPEISAYPSVIQNGDDVLLDGNYSEGTLHWYTTECKGAEIGTGDQLTVTPQSTLFYFAAVEDTVGCYSECDTVRVIVAQPCDVSAYADGASDTLDVCSGTSIDISAIGGCEFLMDDNFDNGSLSVGWSSNADPMFNNPCDTGVDGSTYLWIGSASSFPRELITQQYSVTADCQICFDMRYAEQTGNTGTDCEGPDLTNEGVHIQWSTDDGANWTDIEYYDPNGGHDANLINWNHYCLDVPAAAAGDFTRFRFFQDVTSGNDYDHWGLDNVEISCPTPNQTIQWSYGPTVLDPVDDVSPTTTTPYTIIINDGYNPDNADTATVVVNVIGTPNTSDEAACTSGESVTLTASGGTDFVWYDADAGGTQLGTGSTYTINNLTATTTVYVEEVVSFSTKNYTFDSDRDGWIIETPCSHTSYNWSWQSDGGNGTIWADDPATYSEQLIYSPIIDVSTVGTITLSYSHKCNTENYYDEGVVVYRLDGGNWQQFTPSVIGYDDNTSLSYKLSDNTCSNETVPTYNDDGNSYVTDGGDIDVSSANQVEIGFLFTSDASVGNSGWYIDEVTVTGNGSGACPNSRAEATAYLSDLHASSNTTPPSCYGNNDGEITAEAVDGLGIPISGIFSYDWSTGENTQTISDLSVGSFDVTITDQYDCDASTNIDLPGATTPTSITTETGISGDCNIDSPDDWVYIVDANDDTKVIAAVFDANGGNSLYDTESETEISANVEEYNGEYYLQRVTRVTPVSQGPADVRIYFTQDELDALMAADPSITGISDLAVTKCDESGSWQNCVLLTSSFNTSNIGSGYYAEVSVTSFSKFYIHKDTNFPLPVELVDFTAKCNSEGIEIKWTTSVEINNDYFIIYRSYDGIRFEAVDYVEGNGNSNEIINYSYIDVNASSSNVYYKIEQFDFDGASKESKIISVNCNNESVFVEKYQNYLKINFINTEDVEYQILFTNNIGQTLMTKKINITDKYYSEQINYSLFEKGIYYLSIISDNNEVVTEKIFIP